MKKAKKRALRKSILIFLIVVALGLGGLIGYTIVQSFSKASKSQPTMSSTVAPTQETEEHYSASLFMVGDALLHEPVFESVDQGNGSYDFNSELYRVMEKSDGYDLKFYNQETILGGEELGYSGYPCFNSPQAFGDYMVSQGFNLVSTANNHSYDMGITGLTNSCNYWKSKEGVVTAGSYLTAEEQAEIPVYEKNGITYTFLAWTYGMNGFVLPDGQEYLVNTYQNGTDAMLEQVRQASQLADVCIVSMHWGVEYTTTPTDEQRILAQQLADAGADIIIGNHAHTIEPIEWLNDHSTICFYALGNLISAQNMEVTYVGMYAGLTINKTVKGDETTIEINDVKADLFYNYYNETYVNNFQEIPFSEINETSIGTDLTNEINTQINRIYSSTGWGVTDAPSMYSFYQNDLIENENNVKIGGF